MVDNEIQRRIRAYGDHGDGSHYEWGVAMTHWAALIGRKLLAGSVAALLALGLAPGCQKVFLTEDIYKEAHSHLLPAKLEEDHCPIKQPITAMTPAPPTVNSPNRPARYLTLQEAIAIALENGNVSSRAGSGRGLGDDSSVTFSNPASSNSQTERIRVLALNPAIYYSASEAAYARYDAIWTTGMNWSTTDNVQTGVFSSTNGQGAQFISSIAKGSPTGGVFNVSFIANYQNLTSPPFGAFNVLNPLYTLRLSIGVEQPLLKDFGPINQLLGRFPGIQGNSMASSSTAAGFNTHQATISSFVDRQNEGILISRLRFDQSRAEFERNVQMLVLQEEVAYWTLYNKYGQLYSLEENLRVIHKTWQIFYDKKVAGEGDPAQYYQILGQFWEFRGERVRALQEVLDAERHLRNILGLPIEDGTRLVPITPPTMAEAKTDWDSSLQEALTSRPELAIARDNLRYHQYLLDIQKNNLKPDLRFFARYEPVGFGSSLQGNDTFVDGTGTPRTTNSFRSLASMNFVDYQIGLTLNVPLGYRFEHASIRAARLELAQSYYFLRDQEEKTTRVLANQYQEITNWYKRIEIHRAERLGYLEALKKRIDIVRAGKGTYDLNFLEAQRRFAAAAIKEYNAIAEYNSAIARFEWAKGAALRYNNVHISEGALPQCAHVRAVEYEKERTRSFELRTRPDSLYQPGRLCANKDGDLPVIEDGVMEGKSAPVAGTPKTERTVPPMDVKWTPTAPPVTPAARTPTQLEFAPVPPATPESPRRIDFLPSAPDSTPVLPTKSGPILLPTTNLVPSGQIGFVTMEEGPTTPRFVQSRFAPLPVTLADR